MVRKIIGGILLLLAVVWAVASIATDSPAGLIFTVIFFAVGLPVLLSKAKTKEQKEIKKHTIFGDHAIGLPIDEGAKCSILFDSEGLRVSGSGNEFQLPYNRMTDMQIKTSVEIQKAYTSSIGGAVGGALLFGPLGAIVGGRAKQKKTKTTEYYFVATYIKDDEITYLSFLTNDIFKAQRLIDGKKHLFSSNKRIVEL